MEHMLQSHPTLIWKGIVHWALYGQVIECPPVFHAIMSLIVLTYVSISSVPRPFQKDGCSGGAIPDV